MDSCSFVIEGSLVFLPGIRYNLRRAGLFIPQVKIFVNRILIYRYEYSLNLLFSFEIAVFLCFDFRKNILRPCLVL